MTGNRAGIAGDAMARTLHCYATGQDEEWEAICLDLDISVQGRSFQEVFRSLEEAIALYLESVAELPENERAHLLNRSVPLKLRLQFAWHALRLALSRQGPSEHRHQYTMPLTV